MVTRAPDKTRKMNFNRHYLCYFFTKSYVWPLVRDDSNKWSNIGFGGGIGIMKIKIRTLSGALDDRNNAGISSRSFLLNFYLHREAIISCLEMFFSLCQLSSFKVWHLSWFLFFLHDTGFMWSNYYGHLNSP